MRLCLLLPLLSAVAVHAKLLEECELPIELNTEIQMYKNELETIVATVMDGAFRGKYYEEVEQFADLFGPRPVGSSELEASVQHMAEKLEEIGVVTKQFPVYIDVWRRGEDSAALLEPRFEELHILAVSYGPPTSAAGVVGKVILIQNVHELMVKKAEIKGNIVLFYYDVTDTSVSKVVFKRGIRAAGEEGAIAVLARSLTALSLDTPHTEMVEFGLSRFKIPAATLTVEHASLLRRLIKAGEKVVVHLTIQSKIEESVSSSNLLGTINGTNFEDQFVVFSGHLDSVDIGHGVLDNAVGAFLAYMSIAVLKSLESELSPLNRTLRLILWTGTENGMKGSAMYKAAFKGEISNWTVGLESDAGIFKEIGISFSGSDEAACMLNRILKLFDSSFGTELFRNGKVDTDLKNVATDYQIPVIEPYLTPNSYYNYRHSNADTVEPLNSDDMDQCLAIFASITYVLATLSVPLPRPNRTYNLRENENIGLQENVAKTIVVSSVFMFVCTALGYFY